jgi:large subunit ribosomal protein L23
VKDANNIIRNPLITEKGSRLSEKENKYLFQVDRRANKIDIRNAIKEIFKVAVQKVNIVNQIGKLKRVRHKPGMTAAIKKAIVTLKKGEKIEFK